MIDFELISKKRKTVDFTTRFSPEKRKKRRIEEVISFGKIIDWIVAAYTFSKITSVKITTPRKILKKF